MAVPAFKNLPDGMNLMTTAEFLKRPDDADGTRYELADGQLRVRTSTSIHHGVMKANLSGVIGRHLMINRRELIAASGSLVNVRACSSYNLRSPDLAVTRGPIGEEDIELSDPILLADIMSETNAYIAISNLWAYTTIPSAKEILIVNSMGIEAQLLRRQDDGNWPVDPLHIDETENVTLTSIGLTVPLKDFYRPSLFL